MLPVLFAIYIWLYLDQFRLFLHQNEVPVTRLVIFLSYARFNIDNIISGASR
jgi:hypothetical protein